jgi:hypothetical protein
LDIDIIVYVDKDSDGDDTLDSIDNCPTTYNPDQNDTEGDGEDDACEWLMPYLITNSMKVQQNKFLLSKEV